MRWRRQEPSSIMVIISIVHGQIRWSSVRKSGWFSNNPTLSPCLSMTMSPMDSWLMESRTSKSWMKPSKPLWKMLLSGMRSRIVSMIQRLVFQGGNNNGFVWRVYWQLVQRLSSWMSQPQPWIRFLLERLKKRFMGWRIVTLCFWWPGSQLCRPAWEEHRWCWRIPRWRPGWSLRYRSRWLFPRAGGCWEG